jgi:prefoldin subunit 5
MNVNTLEARKAQLQDQFNQISKQVNELNIELRRLEGAYNVVSELIVEVNNEKEVDNGRPKSKK